MNAKSPLFILFIILVIVALVRSSAQQQQVTIDASAQQQQQINNNSTISLRDLYAKFETVIKRLYHLNSISNLLGWDEQVMMPHNEAASSARGQANAALGALIHEIYTGHEVKQLLKGLNQKQAGNSDDDEKLSEYQQANIKLTQREVDKRSKIPTEIVEELSKLQSAGYMKWFEARKTSNFTLFAPVLKQFIELKKKIANLIDPTKDAYTILVDEYERGLSAARLDSIFGSFKEKLVPFITRVLKAKEASKIDSSFLFSSSGAFKIKKQELLNREIVQRLGFSLQHGRMDISVHPFAMNVNAADVRITTRYKNDSFAKALSAAMHEAGHAIYEQSLNPDYLYQPVAAALGLGLHESSSLLFERHIGLSKHFWQFAWPLATKRFKNLDAKKISSFDVYSAINDVKASFIRVEADEVTYPLHVILRFEIEKELINGELAVDSLPRVWNKKMKDYLGIEPATDREGVLQDVHWSASLFGYFPTYLIGQMCAAQVFHTAQQKIPNLNEFIAAGDFKPLKEWLTTNIYHRGSLYSIDELMTRVTGEPINPQYLLNYFEGKYKEIYNF